MTITISPPTSLILPAQGFSIRRLIISFLALIKECVKIDTSMRVCLAIFLRDFSKQIDESGEKRYESKKKTLKKHCYPTVCVKWQFSIFVLPGYFRLSTHFKFSVCMAILVSCCHHLANVSNFYRNC